MMLFKANDEIDNRYCRIYTDRKAIVEGTIYKNDIVLFGSFRLKVFETSDNGPVLANHIEIVELLSKRTGQVYKTYYKEQK